MPFKDSDNARDRLRFGPANNGPQRRSFSDIRPPVTRPENRNFPSVGRTLSTYQSTAHTAAASAVPLPRTPNPLFQEQTQPSAAPARPATAKVKKRRRIFTKKRVALVFILLVLLGGGWLGTKFFSNVSKIFKGNVFSILTVAKLKGEDTGRVNILLAGNSADDPGHDGANLTDSIMVVSINPKDGSAFMLSVPRDLWVNIPNYGHAKINEAYVDGQSGNFSEPGYPNGGMGLLEMVIQQNLGIPIDYYALVNYNALRDAVNAVGGVDINIQSSDPRGLYDPSIDYATHGPLVKLTNGWHHLTGEQALDLARARGDSYGSYGFPLADFNRTEHQRELILAIKNKALSAGVLANPISLGNLFDSIGKNVQTDFSLSEARRLYDIGKGLNDSNIQSVGLNDANGVNLLASYASPNGESALIPAAGLDDFDQIQLFIKRLTSNDPVTREGASVVVLNGTNTGGLAAKAQTTLESKNINVSYIGDAHLPTTTTTVIDASGGKKPATLKLLETQYGKNVTTQNAYAKVYDADFIVVLGSDQVQTASTAQ